MSNANLLIRSLACLAVAMIIGMAGRLIANTFLSGWVFGSIYMTIGYFIIIYPYIKSNTND